MESGITPMTPLAEVPGSSVGRVQGLLDSTPLLWHVAVQDGAYLQLDDVVVTVRDVPGRGLVTTSGIITEVCARHEGASFGSDVFLISDGVLPAAVQEVAEVTTTRVEPELYVPPRPGETVRRATGDERAQALYFDRMDRKVSGGRWPRRRDHLRQHGFRRRHPRCAHFHLRHLRGRDEDVVCAVPAARHVPRGRAA